MKSEGDEMEPTKMTDREMLLLAYGALKAISYSYSNAIEITNILEDHLYPPQLIIPPALGGGKKE